MKKVICIVGPTAVGKTALSLAIAEAANGEIISADSRQVYRGLNLGTGKITPEEMRGIPHHLIDVADPDEQFSVSEYVELGRRALENIHARGKVPVVVGGTGFYVDSLLGRMTIPHVPPDPVMREQLSGLSIEKLQEMLRGLDPKRYAVIDRNNPRRLVRAIEIAQSPNSTPSTTMIYHSSYTMLWVGLTIPKEELKARIRNRLLERMKQGMLGEARSLHRDGLSYERMEQLGLEYRSMARHLQGLLSEAEMFEQLEKEIIRYAKRQMTWFKRNKDIQWFTPSNAEGFSPEEKEKILRLVKDFCGR